MTCRTNKTIVFWTFLDLASSKEYYDFSFRPFTTDIYIC